MIIVRLLGGLGNQMFQYAFGRVLGNIHKAEVKYDITHLVSRYSSKSMVFRDYDLDVFSFNVKIATNQDIKMFTYPKFNSSYLLYDLINKIFPQKNIYREQNFGYDINSINNGNNKYYIGFWQSYKYIEKFSEIKNDFEIDEVLPESVIISDKIMKSNSVCISYRRKDYLADKYLSTLVGEYFKFYYRESIKYIKNRVDNPVFYVFSDDIEWCKSNFDFDVEHYFIDEIHSGFKYKNKFKLMTLCKHFIIPNSTFPWWAAYLSRNDFKIVIAPVKWFNDSTINTKDLTPINWVRI